MKCFFFLFYVKNIKLNENVSRRHHSQIGWRKTDTIIVKYNTFGYQEIDY